jgi:hypothetical protein
MPVEQRLELVSSVGSDGAYPKRELLHHIVDEVDGVSLRVAAVTLQRANSSSIVDRQTEPEVLVRSGSAMRCQEVP